MIDMVVNQLPLRFADGLLDCVKLLSQFKACPIFAEHRDDALDVALCPLEPLHDFRMAQMNVCLRHKLILSPGKGFAKRIDVHCDVRRGADAWILQMALCRRSSAAVRLLATSPNLIQCRC